MKVDRKIWGIVVPSLTTVGLVVAGYRIWDVPSIQRGILLGSLLALAQSFLCVGAMHRAWQTTYFYWVWGAGVLLRFVVFASTAFAVHQFTSLSLVATMISLVVSTTFFLVFEVLIFLGPLK